MCADIFCLRATNFRKGHRHMDCEYLLYISISIKRSPKRLSANSSGERRRIETNLYQPSGAMLDLQLRGATCANKLPPTSARRKTFNRPSAILDLRRKYTVSRLPRCELRCQSENEGGVCRRTPRMPKERRRPVVDLLLSTLCRQALIQQAGLWTLRKPQI